MFKINCSGFQITHKEPFNCFHFQLNFLLRLMKQMGKNYYK